MKHPAAILTVLAALGGGCKPAPPAAKKDAVKASKAPLDCLHKAMQDPRVELEKSYLVQLCSGATDPDAPIDCFVAAMADSALDVNANGALMLCSPFNFDAFSARQKECPSVSTGSIEARLATIEQRLDELARKR